MSQQNDQNIILAIDEKPKLGQGILLSIQHLFAMFGATVLVPALTGMSPAIALISSGIGTLVFILITRGKVPSLPWFFICFYQSNYRNESFRSKPRKWNCDRKFLGW